ncbi:MAG: SpoIIE family protein phosphatase [Thermodesulfobacteriota bacterium]
MPFRTKLLILLVTVALLPLAVSFIAQLTSIQYFGNKLAGSTRLLLQKNAETLLHTLTTHYGQILKRDRAMAEMALRTQAQAVEKRLCAQPPQDPSPLYFASDYRSSKKQPQDMVRSDKYIRQNSKGNPVPIPVSFNHQVIYVPPGVDTADVKQDIHRLSTMPKVYRSLHHIQPELFLWQYTALESGVHSSYPGKGAYPQDYDPRKRLWYQKAVQVRGQVEQVMTDVSTKTLILTLAEPVFFQNGSLAGVTALDIDYSQFFADWKIPKAWAESADCMVMVFHTERQRSLNRKLEILMHNRRQEGAHRDWRVPVKQKFLDPSQPGMSRIIEDIRAGRSGVRKMPYQGEESLWAYGARSGQEPFPLVIVPYRDVIAQAVTTEKHINRQIDLGLAVGALLTFLAVGLAMYLGIVRSRKVTQPVLQLASAANRLADGDFEARVDIHYCRELDELGQVFNSLGQRLKEREAMKQSLELARIIQQQLLPEDPPGCPGFDLAGRSIYCDETGGDYYDFIALDRDSRSSPCPALALGDVSGHGVGTAMVMASARAMLHALSERHGNDLQTLFYELNRSLCRDTGDAYFMTMFYGLLDWETSTLEWISAGQAPLFLYRRGGGVQQLDSSGIPLGIMEESCFDIPAPLAFAPGDILLLCSDGVWECTDPQGEMFGTERVESLLQDLADRDAAAICEGFLEVLTRFREGEASKDDITLLVIKKTHFG